MKSNLDNLMQEQGLDALWITGSGDHNPNMVYFTGLHHISEAEFMKPLSGTAYLFHNPMEREEAAKTGLHTSSDEISSYSDFLKKTGGDELQARCLMVHAMLKKAGIIKGRVAVSGLKDAGMVYTLLAALQKKLADYEFVGQVQENVFQLARFTKDADELEQIRKVGELTVQVVAQTADLLSGMRAKNGVLVDSKGEPVTIGQVKGQIRLWLAERGLESPEEMIFAQGRDAGIPHSAGNPQDVLCIGAPIIFDIFPCQAGGGYFYDLTRTWCLGYAPDEVAKLYEDVRRVYQTIMAELRVGIPFKHYQERTCELFVLQGHPTIQSDPKIKEGYVHSLGHGVGLNVHERPFSGVAASERDILKPGVVITIEPGLYYPSRNMGARLEDTLYVTPQGDFKLMADYSHDLIIPIRQ
jgi:Xaa-Pro aminopeptidase